MSKVSELKGKKFSAIESFTGKIVSMTPPAEVARKNGTGVVSVSSARVQDEDGATVELRLWGAAIAKVVEGDKVLVEGAYCTEGMNGEPVLTTARKSGTKEFCKISVLTDED